MDLNHPAYRMVVCQQRAKRALEIVPPSSRASAKKNSPLRASPLTVWRIKPAANPPMAIRTDAVMGEWGGECGPTHPADG